jgi:predicted dehydrogenase
MKALVIGGGSIGKRHLQNLKALGVASLGLVEPDRDRNRLVASEISVRVFASLDEGLQWAPDFVVIASPTHLHIEHALAVAKCGIDFFVEKPLSHTPEGIDELYDIVSRKKLISLVGCNMRFHPGPAKVKELIASGRVGKLLFARIHCGSYLPNWRPDSNYRQGYAAHEETGGGCLLDCIHEIDLARWYMGEVQDVSCFADHLSSLQIQTEDVAALLCRHAIGALSEIHLDYVQRTYERGCQVVGEKGSISWDFKDKQVCWHDGDSASATSFPLPEDWDINQMYLDEMQHLLNCIRTRRETMLPVSEASSVMQIAFAAKRSALEGKRISAVREVFA